MYMRYKVLIFGNTTAHKYVYRTITPNKWVIRIDKSAQALRLKLDKIRTEPQQMKKASEEAIISTWQGLQDDYRTYCGVIGFSEGGKKDM